MIRGNKNLVEELAILGGTPAFVEPLHVNRPNIGERKTFDRYVDRIWSSKWFTNFGPLSAELEEVLAKYLGVKNCVLMSSGTSALAVLANALDLSGEVIMPSFTFVSTAHVLNWTGITPVFCDIDPATWNTDPAHCQELIGQKTSAIIATHLWGRPCDVDSLQRIADRHGIRLIFDAAHAFGCSYNGQMIGQFGNAEVFSFHANKVFHAGEGGAVTTNDDDLADRLRAIRNFGFTGYDRVEYTGINAKLSEAAAAIGLTNFEMFDSFVESGRKNYELFRQELSDLDAVVLNQYDDLDKSNYHYIALKLTAESKLARDDIIRILHAENILARRYFFPGCHRMEPYRTMYPDAGASLPNTNHISENVILLPGGASLTEEELLGQCALFRFIIENADSVNRHLAAGKTVGTTGRAN